ncbi:unnamed protein product, partial [Heterosigma akashiwo]
APACCYCGVNEPATMAKCVKSGKWFCNAGHSSGSHIVQHLVCSNHNQVQLHPESPMGGALLECYNCSEHNVFLLGHAPVTSNAIAMLLCRKCVATAAGLREMGVDLAEWLPVIQDRRFLAWLVKEPIEQQQLCAQQVTDEQITKLEALWKIDPDATLEQAAAPEAEDTTQPMLSCYEDGYHYQNVLAPLVKLEANQDRRTKEALAQEGLSIRWECGLSDRPCALFHVPDALQLVPGDELRLRLGPTAAMNGKAWEASGHVLDLEDGQVTMEFQHIDGLPKEVRHGILLEHGFILEVVSESTRFDRMQAALKTFAVDDSSVSGYLYHKILGHEVEAQVFPGRVQSTATPGLPALSAPQAAAVRAAFQQPLSLIQGPPGTGKSIVLATIAYHLARENRDQVLVCALTNMAIDHLAEKINRTGLPVVCLKARNQETANSSVEHLSPLNIYLELYRNSELNKLVALREEVGELSAEDARQLRRLRWHAEREILQAADVICTTCVGAGDPRLADFYFPRVVIDDATAANQAECLIPVVLGAKQLVLAGDPYQLGPVVNCTKAARAGLTQSLFERLVKLGLRPMRLQIQYRMHPCLAEFPNYMFYDGLLQDGVGADERRLSRLGFPWPQPDKPMLFQNVPGLEEISGCGKSYLNRTEAFAVKEVVTRLLKGGARPDQVGVVTPYEGQRAFVIERLCNEVEVASVDSFQGREKDFIVLTCVRSDEFRGIDILCNPFRLNVMLTRAQYSVVVVGNARVLSKNPLWHALVSFFRDRGCLMEGPLNALRPVVAAYPRPGASKIAHGPQYK